MKMTTDITYEDILEVAITLNSYDRDIVKMFYEALRIERKEDYKLLVGDRVWDYLKGVVEGSPILSKEVFCNSNLESGDVQYWHLPPMKEITHYLPSHFDLTRTRPLIVGDVV